MKNKQEEMHKEIEDLKRLGYCINCKQPALDNCYSEDGIKEYFISGLCEKCFDKLTLLIDEEYDDNYYDDDNIAF